MSRNEIFLAIVIVIFHCELTLAKSEGQHIEIVGGIVSPPGDLPEVAAIIRDGTSVHCTGVLVAPNVVLTAGHCTTANITHVFLDTYELAAPGEIIGVDQVIAHPDSFRSYDIALLILKQDSSTTPVQIAHGCAKDFIVDDAAAIIAGWGATDPNGVHFPSDLHEAVTTIVDAECDDFVNTDCKPSISPGAVSATERGSLHAAIEKAPPARARRLKKARNPLMKCIDPARETCQLRARLKRRISPH